MIRKVRKRGFSLLELVAVVTLLGIVAAVTLTRLNSTDRSTSIANVTAENIRMIQGAIERYNFDNGTFPTTVADLVSNGYLAKAPPVLEPGKSYSIDANGVVTYQ